MEKSLNRAAAVSKSASSTWLAFTVIGLCGGLIGATATYLALRPKLSVTPIAAASLAKTAADPLAHLPPPELTAGQAPAQAERTLGNFYYDHQNWPAAIRSYQAAIQQGSDDADIRTDLGNAYRFSQGPDDALVQYQLAQKMNSAHEFSLFNQGGLYLEDLHQPQKAITAWREYLRRFPTSQKCRQRPAMVGSSRKPPGRITGWSRGKPDDRQSSRNR